MFVFSLFLTDAPSGGRSKNGYVFQEMGVYAAMHTLLTFIAFPSAPLSTSCGLRRIRWNYSQDFSFPVRTG